MPAGGGGTHDGTDASGIGLFLVGDGIVNRAMAANPFFEPVVRIQQERGQHVISAGPYAFARHPRYVEYAARVRWKLLPGVW
jgi:protein-S-isoprenylcysteine O-methyltransferase Ste14